jgi:hypothetical protein
MTEAEWLEGAELGPLFQHFVEQASARKQRLLAVACCYPLLPLLADQGEKPHWLRRVKRAEEQADGRGVGQAPLVVDRHPRSPAGHAELAVAYVNVWSVGNALSMAHNSFLRAAANRKAALATLIRWMRDLLGNPFRPSPAVDPAWLRWNGAAIPHLAQTMYDTRDFTDLPILGDMLEEVGCANQDILTHCHQPGDHVRGCWVIDSVLNKE